MKVYFMVFAALSLVMMVDGNTILKEGTAKGLGQFLPFMKHPAKKKIAGIHLVIAGLLTGLWTLAGYFLNDLLLFSVFVFGYFIILLFVGISLVIFFKRKDKDG